MRQGGLAVEYFPNTRVFRKTDSARAGPGFNLNV
jgi:hypothetical protein